MLASQGDVLYTHHTSYQKTSDSVGRRCRCLGALQCFATWPTESIPGRGAEVLTSLFLETNVKLGRLKDIMAEARPSLPHSDGVNYGKDLGGMD